MHVGGSWSGVGPWALGKSWEEKEEGTVVVRGRRRGRGLSLQTQGNVTVTASEAPGEVMRVAFQKGHLVVGRAREGLETMSTGTGARANRQEAVAAGGSCWRRWVIPMPPACSQDECPT